MTKQKKSVPTRTEVFDDFVKDEPELAQNPGENTPSRKSYKKDDLDTSNWFSSEERKPRRIAMTFTLDPDVIEMIEKAAEKHKLSRSRIVEKIAMKTLSSF